MAAVYLATHPNLPRKVALKILSDKLDSTVDARVRFRLEADHAARLEHPNIVVVFDRGETDGYMWIAMQYVPGADALITSRRAHFDPKLAVQVISATAQALDFAHGQGVLHRDVKPSNILIRETSTPGDDVHVLLADFGIAKSMADASPLTGTGFVFGSMPYCAPEQIRGDSLGPSADQYSLACTFFQLLIGRPPFMGDQVSVMNSQLHTPPPRLGDLDPRLRMFDPAMSVALAKDPAARFSTCRQFSDAIVRAFQSLGSVPAESDVTARHITSIRGSSSAPETISVAVPEPSPDRLPTPRPARRGVWRRIGVTVAALVMCIAALSIWIATRDTPAPTVSTVPITGLNFPVGIDSTRSGTLYIADTSNNRIVVFDTTTRRQQVLGLTALREPAAVAVGTDGTVFVADTKNDRVVSWDGHTQQTVDLGPLRRPSGVATSASGELFVTDTGNRRVLAWRPGEPVRTLPFTGLQGPVGIAVANGEVAVSEPGDGRIVRLGVNGQSVKTGLSEPIGIAFHDSDLYVAEHGTNALIRLTGLVGSTVVDKVAQGAAGVTVSDDGTVYLVDSQRNRVVAVTLPAS